MNQEQVSPKLETSKNEPKNKLDVEVDNEIIEDIKGMFKKLITKNPTPTYKAINGLKGGITTKYGTNYGHIVDNLLEETKKQEQPPEPSKQQEEGLEQEPNTDIQPEITELKTELKILTETLLKDNKEAYEKIDELTKNKIEEKPIEELELLKKEITNIKKIIGDNETISENNTIINALDFLNGEWGVLMSNDEKLFDKYKEIVERINLLKNMIEEHIQGNPPQPIKIKKQRHPPRKISYTTQKSEGLTPDKIKEIKKKFMDDTLSKEEAKELREKYFNR